MLRLIPTGLLTIAGVLGLTSQSQAQVFVRAPFVRVFVGGPYGPGTHVRAPFVNLWFPNTNYPPPGMILPPPPGTVVPPTTQEPPAGNIQQPPGEVSPAPRSTINNPLTLDQFAKAFQPKPGNYEVNLINPVTKAPTLVRFTLPEGSPRRVEVRNDQLEFNYGRRHYVRIEFDEDGAAVVSR